MRLADPRVFIAATVWAQAGKTLLLKSLEPYTIMANKDQAGAQAALEGGLVFKGRVKGERR